MKITSASGNVLFIILIAVGLFAALSYTVSNSFRGGTTDISSGQARVTASEILAFHASIRDGVNYLMSRNGCSESELNLKPYNDEWHRVNKSPDENAANPNARSDDTCSLFHPKGAGLSPKVFTSGMLDISALREGAQSPGHSRFTIMAIEDIGSDLPDLILYTDHPSVVTCEAVNTNLKQPKTITNEVQGNGTRYLGNFSALGSNTDVDGHSLHTACITYKTTGWMQPGFDRISVRTVVLAR